MAQGFSCEFCEIFKYNFFTKHLCWLLLYNCSQRSFQSGDALQEFSWYSKYSMLVNNNPQLLYKMLDDDFKAVS